MKSVVHPYVLKRECSLQQAVDQIIPELWWRKVFPEVLYVHSNIPENRVRRILSKKEIAELTEDSTDIYKRNMVNGFMVRPHDALFE